MKINNKVHGKKSQDSHFWSLGMNPQIQGISLKRRNISTYKNSISQIISPDCAQTQACAAIYLHSTEHQTSLAKSLIRRPPLKISQSSQEPKSFPEHCKRTLLLKCTLGGVNWTITVTRKFSINFVDYTGPQSDLGFGNLSCRRSQKVFLSIAKGHSCSNIHQGVSTGQCWTPK